MSPRRRRPPNVHGVVILDKPLGLTSHDVVARVRRHFRQRRVGHAGTLDPAASGVLVVMLGEATKLAPYLTAHDKAYRARVQLGSSTDTLDAQGQITARAPLPAWLDGGDAAQRIEAALEAERQRTEQLPPAYSAIKIDGQAAHRLARQGQAPELPARPIEVRALQLESLTPPGQLELTVRVSKGYYVRSLARDLGERLGVPAHLAALRRLASGPYLIDEAVALDSDLQAALMPPATAAARALPTATLNEQGCAAARQGQALSDTHFTSPPPAEGLSAWLDKQGALVALGQAQDGRYQVKRGFAAPEPPSPAPVAQRDGASYDPDK